MRRRLILSTAAIALAAVIVLGVPLGAVEAARLRGESTSRLEREADQVSAAMDDRLERGQTITPALAAGVAALADVEHTRRARESNDRWLPWFRDQASALGLKAWPSAGNFVLLEFPGDAARGADAACRFLNERGIIPRRMAAYGLPDCLRFTIGGEAEMRAVVEALADFVAGRG